MCCLVMNQHDRVGASDRILAGQSTFYVELSETADILHHATDRCNIIINNDTTVSDMTLEISHTSVADNMGRMQ